jgi:hypothetical protein
MPSAIAEDTPAMLKPPNASPRSRSSAEAKYRTLRDLACQAAMHDLAAVGIHAELRGIDAAALAAAAQWTDRHVAWPWHTLAADWRRNHPNRFEVAIRQNGVLCGLALGRPAPTAPHMSLYYLEADPNPANPLRRRVTRGAVAALLQYAALLGKTELRLIDPLPPLVPFYCSPAFGFELVTPGKGVPYCRRSL